MNQTAAAHRRRSTRLALALLFFAVAVIFISGAAVGAATATLLAPKPATPAQATLTNARLVNDLVIPSAPLSDMAPQAADSADDRLVAAVARVKPATVTILTEGGSGSGVFIDQAGHLITNNHVVEGSRRFVAVYADGSRVSASLVGTAPEFDLAVLEVDGRVPAVATLGDSSQLLPGSRVAAIGSALGDFRNTVTAGVLSGHNRSLDTLDGLLQTDAPINHGNSGGPLINLDGEVIGINVAVVRGSAGMGDPAEGLGFSIPSNTVRVVADQLIATGTVRRPYLGISFEPMNPQIAAENGIGVSQGAYVREVVSNGPSAQAGLRAGDVIVALGNSTIDDQTPLPQALLPYAVGSDVTLDVVRGDQELTITVKLRERPRN
jgi:2-alkenal reductase